MSKRGAKVAHSNKEADESEEEIEEVVTAGPEHADDSDDEILCKELHR
jgi:hypothetical protein